MKDGNGKIWKPDHLVKGIIQVLRAGGYLKFIHGWGTKPHKLLVCNMQGDIVRSFNHHAKKRLESLLKRNVIQEDMKPNHYRLTQQMQTSFRAPPRNMEYLTPNPQTILTLRITPDQTRILAQMNAGAILKTWIQPKTGRRSFMLIDPSTGQEIGARMSTSASGNALLRKGLIKLRHFYKTTGYKNHIDGVEYALCETVPLLRDMSES